MTVEHDAVIAELRAWIAEQPAAGDDRQAARERLVDSGWAAPTWPSEWYGRGLSLESAPLVARELRAAGIRGGGQDISNLWANVVLHHGTEEQKRVFVRRLALSTSTNCLLYSEPGAGSDLAAVQTRADSDGDGWRVNGQKVWTSGAAEAEFGLLLARTDWDVPKHRGVSLFLMPMRQAGVEVRPIPQVTGGAHFNEVFLTDARVEPIHLLGELGGGWRVLQTALGYERALMGAETAESPTGQGGPDPHSPWTRVVGGVDYLELARRTGIAARDAEVRREIVRVYSLEKVNEWNALRAKAERGQGPASPVASIGKLAMSAIVHSAVRLTSTMLGAESMLDGPEFPDAAEVNRSSFAAFVTSIGGGTDQIQRNIIGERVLGLPKEPEVDRDVPFRDVRKATPVRRA